jgi:hypothetical protein
VERVSGGGGESEETCLERRLLLRSLQPVGVGTAAVCLRSARLHACSPTELRLAMSLCELVWRLMAGNVCCLMPRN